MGPKYNVATCVEELGGTRSYWRSKHPPKRVEVPNLAQAAKLELLAVGRCEVEGKAINSFNTRPKAPHGYQIQCCNMRRRIGEHQIILEEQTSFEEGQRGLGPGKPNRSCWPLQSGRKGHPFLQYMPKGSQWIPNTMLQHA